jgi:hypothetical protein
VDEVTLPEPVDYSICCDVMEHLPESQVDDALQNITSQTTHATYFYIATIPDSGVKDGKLYILHPTVRDNRWWSQKLSPYGFLSYERMDKDFYEAILWTS